MGVHDKEQIRAVKAILGIPQDEPIFILRAQDMVAVNTLMDYEQNYKNLARDLESYTDGRLTEVEITRFAASVQEAEREFSDWGDNHPDKQKLPDLP